MIDNPAPGRVQREARLQWVPISQMRVSPLAQRDLNQARVDRLAASFDPEQLGTPPSATATASSSSSMASTGSRR
jgi:hypothetical protein